MIGKVNQFWFTNFNKKSKYIYKNGVQLEIGKLDQTNVFFFGIEYTNHGTFFYPQYMLEAHQRVSKSIRNLEMIQSHELN